MYKTKRANGFTIIELLIVIIVIGILATLILLGYNNISGQAAASAAKADLIQTAKAITLDREKSGGVNYPINLSVANGGAGITTKSGTVFAYTVANTPTPASFCLTAVNGASTYSVTNTAQSPAIGSCMNTTGIVGWWPLNANATDFSGNNNPGTIYNGTPTVGQDNVNNDAYSFTGTASGINFGNATTFNAANLTLSVWIKPSSLATVNQNILAKELQYKYRINGTTLTVLQSANGSSWNTTQNFTHGMSVGNWYLTTLVLNSSTSTGTMYINGASLGSFAITPITSFNNSPFYAGTYGTGGGSGNGENFAGSMDGIRFYNRALSASEVLAIYTAGSR